MPYESLPVVHAVRQVLQTATSDAEVIDRVLEAVGGSMGWLVGAFWVPRPQDDDLEARCVWTARIHKRLAFAEETRTVRVKSGQGLPGRVWSTRETVWVEDVVVEPEFLRSDAARGDGLHAAVAFPVRHRDRMIGVMEFYTDVLRAPVQTLLPVFAQIGAEVGQFMAGESLAGEEPEGEPGEAAEQEKD